MQQADPVGAPTQSCSRSCSIPLDYEQERGHEGGVPHALEISAMPECFATTNSELQTPNSKRLHRTIESSSKPGGRGGL